MTMQSLRSTLALPLSLLLWLALAAVAPGPAAADPYVLPELLSSPPPLPDSVDVRAALRLDLPEALRIAFRQNLGISVEREQLRSARLSERLAQVERYDPKPELSYSHENRHYQVPSLLAGSQLSLSGSTTDRWGASVTQDLPTGGSLRLGLDAVRASSASDGLAAPLSYHSGLSWRVSQPLLRGFSRDLAIPRYSILTAKIATERQRKGIAISAAALVQQTEQAYWSVVTELYSYGVAVRSQKLAEDTVALTRRKIEAGIALPSELTGVEATLAERRISVLGAEASIEKAWDELRTVLNLPRDQWTQPILPIDRPAFESGSEITAQAALEIATARRPELAQADLDIQASKLSMRKTRNDMLPQIDLSLEGAVTGEGARLSDSLSSLGGRDTRNWGVMLNLTWTPRPRPNRIKTQLAHIEHENKLTAREQMVQQIWNEVRDAVRNQRAAALRVTAAAKARELANESLEIETRQFQSGSSSSLNLGQRQENLAQAQLAELGALLDHERAHTALLLATGQLLEQRHIDLEVMR
jgi:outer membrane protein TolC